MIRKWYGIEDTNFQVSDANSALEELLTRYADGLTRYFKLPEQPNIQSVVTAAKKLELSKGEDFFLVWLEQKGVRLMHSIALKDFGPSEEIEAKLKYETYILNVELGDFEYPDEVRACLIHITNFFEYLP